MLPAARRGGPVVARDGGLVMTGTALGVSDDVPLIYVLGRRHVEQYVGPLAPGRLQALPLAFDPVRGEWCDLFAGEGRRPEDFGHWTNRGMNADAQCIFAESLFSPNKNSPRNADSKKKEKTPSIASGWPITPPVTRANCDQLVPN